MGRIRSTRLQKQCNLLLGRTEIMEKEVPSDCYLLVNRPLPLELQILVTLESIVAFSDAIDLVTKLQ